jgi:hypothetical protein
VKFVNFFRLTSYKIIHLHLEQTTNQATLAVSDQIIVICLNFRCDAIILSHLEILLNARDFGEETMIYGDEPTERKKGLASTSQPWH